MRLSDVTSFEHLWDAGDSESLSMSKSISLELVHWPQKLFCCTKFYMVHNACCNFHPACVLRLIILALCQTDSCAYCQSLPEVCHQTNFKMNACYRINYAFLCRFLFDDNSMAKIIMISVLKNTYKTITKKTEY